ncbi:hypothetical protein Pfo_021573 [Paulownia fortunei]|nr:hypothetical protein Pfo_021573 [Paulownia fortunei]
MKSQLVLLAAHEIPLSDEEDNGKEGLRDGVKEMFLEHHMSHRISLVLKEVLQKAEIKAQYPGRQDAGTSEKF